MLLQDVIRDRRTLLIYFDTTPDLVLASLSRLPSSPLGELNRSASMIWKQVL